MTEDKEYKDYIVNVRISRATYEKIKQKAKENKDSISSFVRKAIEDSGEIISDLSKEIFGKKEEFKDIMSYHKAKFAKEVACAACHAAIPIGALGVVGETKSGKRYYFCTACR